MGYLLSAGKCTGRALMASLNLMAELAQFIGIIQCNFTTWSACLEKLIVAKLVCIFYVCNMYSNSCTTIRGIVL